MGYEEILEDEEELECAQNLELLLESFHIAFEQQAPLDFEEILAEAQAVAEALTKEAIDLTDSESEYIVKARRLDKSSKSEKTPSEEKKSSKSTKEEKKSGSSSKEEKKQGKTHSEEKKSGKSSKEEKKSGKSQKSGSSSDKCSKKGSGSSSDKGCGGPETVTLVDRVCVIGEPPVTFT